MKINEYIPQKSKTFRDNQAYDLYFIANTPFGIHGNYKNIENRANQATSEILLLSTLSGARKASHITNTSCPFRLVCRE